MPLEKMIKVSTDVRETLRKLSSSKDETYSDVIVRLIERHKYLTDEDDVAVKVRAAQDHVKPSDIVHKAIDQYLGLDKKDKKR